MNLHEFLDNQEETNTESFQVTDDQQANWALRKIKQHQELQKENNLLAESEIEKINAWVESENDKAQQSIDYFQSLLSAYALKLREADPKFKSSKLPNGKIKFAKQQPKWNLKNEVVLKSLKEAGETDLIKVIESPRLADIKKAFVINGNEVINPDTGEIVEGIEIEHREDKFSVEVTE